MVPGRVGPPESLDGLDPETTVDDRRESTVQLPDSSPEGPGQVKFKSSPVPDLRREDSSRPPPGPRPVRRQGDARQESAPPARFSKATNPWTPV